LGEGRSSTGVAGAGRRPPAPAGKHLDFDERQRFEQTALRHLDAAYNLARWLVRDPHAAEDVVQEAYCRAARYFASYRGGDGRTWLLTVVRRAAYDWLAERRVWPTQPADEESLGAADESFDPEIRAVRQADQEMLRRAVEELPPEFREVTILRELEGLSYQQIAAIAGIPIGTVMSRLSRARRQLQQQLARCPGGED
jgi:RNA polymerase sigma factor (sigma-70 family)